ncbi:MAG: hypothetical protein H7338_01975 [Candidatus Sericytochromatia bacterium]|nr:hypothetical protein [Candidatus Sericytochromatia bacterium]
MRRPILTTLSLALLAILPAQAAPSRELIYLNGLGGTWVVDSETFKVVQTVPTKGLSQGMTMSEDGKTLYILTGQRELLEVVDRASGKLLDTLSFSDPGRTKARMYGILVLKDRLYAYLSTTRFDGLETGKQDKFHLGQPEIVALDLKTKKKVGSLAMPLGILNLQPIVGGTRFYAMGRDLYDIDAATLKVQKILPLDPPPMEGEGQIMINAEWVHPETAAGMSGYPYYTTDPITKKTTTGLMTLDDQDGTIDHFEIGPPINSQFGFSAALTPDRKRAFMTMNKLLEIDMTKRRVTRVMDYGKTYYAVTMSSDGKHLYLSSSGANLTEVDSQTLKVTRELELPAEVWDVTVLPAEGGPTGTEIQKP